MDESSSRNDFETIEGEKSCAANGFINNLSIAGDASIKLSSSGLSTADLFSNSSDFENKKARNDCECPFYRVNIKNETSARAKRRFRKKAILLFLAVVFIGFILGIFTGIVISEFNDQAVQVQVNE